MQGLAYTTYAVVLWGSIPYMVEGRTLGTAFGICSVCQNVGTLIAPLIITSILAGEDGDEESDPNYKGVEIFFVGVSLISTVSLMVIQNYDKKKRGNLLQSIQPLVEFERYTT